PARGRGRRDRCAGVVKATSAARAAGSCPLGAGIRVGGARCVRCWCSCRKESPVARSPRRIAAALLLSGATALGVGACSPITTLQPYNPSDGVRGVLGTQISTDNLMILTDAEGSPGLLLGGVTNKSGDEAQVSFALDG